MRRLSLPIFVWASLLVVGCTENNPAGLPDLMVAPDLSLVFPMGCNDGIKDGDETDTDCGGSCAACGAGMGCKGVRDCASMFCTNGKCDPPACTDGVKNGTESDTDCGGTCPGCAVGKMCTMGTDCMSMTCTNGLCVASPCVNGKQDGQETDIDCGGPGCMPCDDGKTCQQGTDCKGMTCTNNKCRGAIMCMAGTADCDGNAGNGCEANTNNDPKNCGKCGNACPVGMPKCSSGKCTASGTNVLLVYHEFVFAGMDAIPDLKAKLMATGAFAVIDGFDEQQATPTVQQLQKYDVAFLMAGTAWRDNTSLGDNLAKYFDGGGRVVLSWSCYLNGPPYSVGGAFGNGYLLMKPGKAESPSDSLGTLDEPMSPLVAGLNSLGASMAYKNTAGLANGAVVVAHWKGGQPLIVRGVVKGRNRVDLNFMPGSKDGVSYGWTGDGAILMKNALLYQ